MLQRSAVADPKIAIAEVAYLVGYAQPSAFHRAFSSVTSFRNRNIRRLHPADLEPFYALRL
jgi:AraC-like DNA-binding protein